MAQGPDQFCGICGNPRVAGMSACPKCGTQFETPYGGLSGDFQGTTQLTPTEGAPRITEPIWPNSSSPTHPSGVFQTLQPNSATPAPANPPTPVSPQPSKPLPLGKILIGQGVAIVLLLVLVVVLLVRPSNGSNTSNTGTATGPGVATGATATTGPTATMAPTATIAPTATATPAPKPGDLLCNVDIGSWNGGTPDWKLLNGRLLNDGSGGGVSNGPTKVAPCQLGNRANYAVEVKMQVTYIDIYGGGNFGITVRGSTPSSGGWQGYAACACGSSASIKGINGGLSADAAFDAGTDVHTYRVEVKDNVVNFIIDGALIVTLTDNAFLTGSQVGLWCEADQLEVFSFQVFAL